MPILKTRGKGPVKGRGKGPGKKARARRPGPYDQASGSLAAPCQAPAPAHTGEARRRQPGGSVPGVGSRAYRQGAAGEDRASRCGPGVTTWDGRSVRCSRTWAAARTAMISPARTRAGDALLAGAPRWGSACDPNFVVYGVVTTGDPLAAERENGTPHQGRPRPAAALPDRCGHPRPHIHRRRA